MKTLKKFEFKEFGSRSDYDWAKLLDGGIYQLTEGEDFNCKATTFSTLARNRAHKQGKTLKVGKVTVEEGGAAQIVICAGPVGSYIAPPKEDKDEDGNQE